MRKSCKSEARKKTHMEQVEKKESWSSHPEKKRRLLLRKIAQSLKNIMVHQLGVGDGYQNISAQEKWENNKRKILWTLNKFCCYWDPLIVEEKKSYRLRWKESPVHFFLLIPPPAPLPHLTSLENRVIRPLYLLSHDKKDFPEKNGIVRWLKIFWQYPYT